MTKMKNFKLNVTGLMASFAFAATGTMTTVAYGSRDASTLDLLQRSNDTAAPYASNEIIANTMSSYADPIGLAIIIFGVIALLAGAFILWTIARPRSFHIARHERLSRRSRFFTPLQTGDPMSPFAPKRGL
jgi:hypothetical protein